MYRNEWTGLTEPRVVQGALACLDDLGGLRPDAVRAHEGGRARAKKLSPEKRSAIAREAVQVRWRKAKKKTG